MSTPTAHDGRTPPRLATDTELLSTLFDLGREVTSVLDLEELLVKIPQLIARLTKFSAFSVYLLDERRQELRIAYAVGYPEGAPDTMRRKGRVIGALNLLNEVAHAFTERDEALLRQFGAHVAVALENARLFRSD